MAKLQWKYVIAVAIFAVLVAIVYTAITSFVSSEEPVISDKSELYAPQPQAEDNPVKTMIVADLSDEFTSDLNFMLESVDGSWSDSELVYGAGNDDTMVANMSVPSVGDYLLTVVGYWDVLDGRLAMPITEYPLTITNGSVNEVVINVVLNPTDSDRVDCILTFAGLNGKSRARVDNLPYFVNMEMDRFNDKAVAENLKHKLDSMGLEHCYPNKGGEA